VKEMKLGYQSNAMFFFYTENRSYKG